MPSEDGILDYAEEVLREEQQEYGTINTPYDDAFRTMLVDCTRLVIPVINEVFGKRYCGNEKVILYPNEHYIKRRDGEEEKRITDAAFSIVSN